MSDDDGSQPRDPVHIWLVYPHRISRPSRIADYEKMLDEEERRRYGRFFHRHDAHTFLVSHALVRSALSLHVPWVSPEMWQFRQSRFGRPFISFPEECSDWRFSLSHCQGLAACMVACGVDVGVDVESLDRQADMEAIARQFFAKNEIELLRQTPDASRQTVFIRLWTLKEAYLKARGTGLSTPLSHCAFDVLDPSHVRVAFHGDLDDVSEQWVFKVTVLDGTHVMGIAAKRNDMNQSFQIRTNAFVP